MRTSRVDSPTTRSEEGGKDDSRAGIPIACQRKKESHGTEGQTIPERVEEIYLGNVGEPRVR